MWYLGLLHILSSQASVNASTSDANSKDIFKAFQTYYSKFCHFTHRTAFKTTTVLYIVFIEPKLTKSQDVSCHHPHKLAFQLACHTFSSFSDHFRTLRRAIQLRLRYHHSKQQCLRRYLRISSGPGRVYSDLLQRYDPGIPRRVRV